MRITFIYFILLVVSLSACQKRYWFRETVSKNVSTLTIKVEKSNCTNLPINNNYNYNNTSLLQHTKINTLKTEKCVTPQNLFCLNKLPLRQKRAFKTNNINKILVEDPEPLPDPEKAKMDTQRAWFFLFLVLLADFLALLSLSIGGSGILFGLATLFLSYLSISKSISAMRNNRKKLFLPILAILLVLFFVFIILAIMWAFFDSANA